MTSRHSIKSGKKTKSNDFPLFLHRSGQWAKKVRQKLHYFGTDKQKAIERWLSEKDYLLAGKKPRTGTGDCLTVKRLIGLFMDHKESRVQTGELSPATLADYVRITKVVADELGRQTSVELLDISDFKALRLTLAKNCNLKTLEGRIAYVRAIFNYADQNGLLDTPMSKIWGVEFEKPSSTSLEKLRNETTRLFTANEIHALLDTASLHLKAMILLGVNCGYGPTDIGKLRFDHVDLVGGWVDQPRSKTGQKRRCPLWPETIEAINEYLKVRSTPKDDDDLKFIFITKYGKNWIPKVNDSPLSSEFAKLRTKAKLTGAGKSFYSLRHTFQTTADGSREFLAVRSIMGHAANSISDNYREMIDDSNLQAATDHVRAWLFEGVNNG